MQKTIAESSPRGFAVSKLKDREITHDRIPSCGGDGTIHFFSQTDKKLLRRAFLDMG